MKRANARTLLLTPACCTVKLHSIDTIFKMPQTCIGQPLEKLRMLLRGTAETCVSILMTPPTSKWVPADAIVKHTHTVCRTLGYSAVLVS